MGTKEYLECLSYMDPTEVLMRLEKPCKFATEGNIEDAIACTIAEGFRLGWEAYKKKNKRTQIVKKHITTSIP